MAEESNPVYKNQAYGQFRELFYFYGESMGSLQ